ncbi:MAG TPA: hypothetical protein VGR29_09495 [Thermomicrobiales bacterium]|nr:hypothetical protein [Thermomicrobiales bacterium]
MTESTITRQCGNCGQAVSEGDVTCPHCDVLLAAYEAPAGATSGTASATTPVSMPAEPASAPIPPVTQSSSTYQRPVYTSPTTDTAGDLNANRPTPLSPTPAFDRPRSSPVADAVERTRAAIDETAEAGDKPGTPNTETASTSTVARRERELLGMPATPVDLSQGTQEALDRSHDARETPPASSTTTIRPRRHQSQERPASPAPQSTPMPGTPQQEVIPTPTLEWPRPTPEERAATRQLPVIPSNLKNNENQRHQERYRAQPSTTGGRPFPNIRSVVGFVIMLIIVMRFLSVAPFSGLIFIPIVIMFLVWLMTAIARTSGRKTTAMPKAGKHDRHR